MTKLDLYAPHREAMEAQRENGGPAHWRSLDHKAGTPAARAFAEQEFPHGAALPPEENEILADGSTVGEQVADGKGGFRRREALKLMGASLALAGVGTACIRRPETEILPYTHMPEHVIPGLARYYASSYPGPNGAVGIVVEAHEGRPTKIEGNPDHPGSMGRANVWMQSHVLELYDPDRSRTPMKGGAAATWSQWDGEAMPAIQKKLAGSGGKGFALLSDASGGPTFDRLVSRLRQKYPQAEVYSYDLMRADAALEGAELVFGPGARVAYDLENAGVVLSLDSNFLAHGPDQVKNAWGFTRARSFERIPTAKQASSMNRLYTVESAFTITGATADHRLRVRSSEIAGFAKALAGELAKQGVSLPGVSGLSTGFKASDEKFIPALAKDLAQNRGKAVVLVGEEQPAAVHALAHLINQALGAFGPVAKVSVPAGASTTAAATPSDAAADASATGAAAAPAGTTTSSSTAKPHESSIAQLAKLTKALEAGQVDTLLIVGANPAYASPAALGFGDALAKAKQVVHVGLYADETSKKAEWHLPMAHPLETWGDALSWEGVYSPIQPVILPLFGGRAGIEVLAQLIGEADASAKGLVEATFAEQAKGADWRKTLHDGVARLGSRTTSAGAAATAGNASTALAALKDPAAGDDVEVLFQPSFTVLDGRYANLGWLQECTDPMTKLVWGNAAVMSPTLAQKLGVRGGLEKSLYVGDVVRVELGGKAVELPAFVLPGVEPNTIVLSLGYGRSSVGEVGNEVGVDVYPLLPADGTRVARGAKVTKTGARATLLSTQDHFAVEGDPEKPGDTLGMSGRHLAVDGTVAEYQKDPDFARNAANMMPGLREKDAERKEPKPITGLQMYKLDVTDQPWKYEGQAWGMTIDLTACIACQACVVACQSENSIPVVGPEGVEFGRELHWIRIDRYFTGDVDNPEALLQPVPCMHCENAPCEPVCPVGATVHDEEGLNAMVYNRCIGTRYCANNCPYKVRRFNYFDYSHSGNLYVDPHIAKRQKTLKMLRNPDVTVRYRGVMEKCTYCTQRIEAAKFEAKRRGEDPRNLPDGAVTPACAQTCPTNAIVFGNINGKTESGQPYEVAKRKSSERNYEMLSELNVRPRTTFLARLRNQNPELV